MKKKIVILMALAMTVVSVFAEGKWTIVTQEADELTGAEAGTVYIYTVEGMGDMVVWDWEQPQFRLIGVRQFDTKVVYSQYSGSYTGINVNVGIYSSNGVLEEKFTMWLDAERSKANRYTRTRDAGGMFNPIGQKKRTKKIFAALHNPDKYVRFVCDRYNDTYFDLTVYPVNKP